MPFTFLDLPKRDVKKREQGITMVLDKGLSCADARSLMVANEWIDVIKLGWCTSLIFPEESLKRKIKIYRENGIEVSNGGTLLELSYEQGKIDEFFNEAKRIGLTIIEVSTGKINIPHREKSQIIEEALNHGFEVFSEVGKKDPILDRKLSLKERVREARDDLKAGAKKVIIEARESGKLGIYDQSCNVKEEFAKKIASNLGLKNVIFEAPKKNQQVWLILTFGSKVNLGNILPEDIFPLETLRRGIRGDTFGRIS